MSVLASFYLGPNVISAAINQSQQPDFCNTEMPYISRTFSTCHMYTGSVTSNLYCSEGMCRITEHRLYDSVTTLQFKKCSLTTWMWTRANLWIILNEILQLNQSCETENWNRHPYILVKSLKSSWWGRSLKSPWLRLLTLQKPARSVRSVWITSYQKVYLAPFSAVLRRVKQV